MSVHNHNHADDAAEAAMNQAAHQQVGDLNREVESLRAELSAVAAERDRMREALTEIATPDTQSFYIMRDGRRELAAEWAAVQCRMDLAQRVLALTPHAAEEKHSEA